MEKFESSDKNIENEKLNNFDKLDLNKDAEIYLQQVDGTDPERWSQMSNDEKLNLLDILDTRLNEVLRLQGNKIQMCLDSPIMVNNTELSPLVKQYLTMRESKPELFEAPDDTEQINLAIEQLKEIESLKPENWMKLTKEERLEVMQETENRVAQISHRDPCPVKCIPMTDRNLGFYDPRSHTITLREDLLLSNNIDSYKQNLDTLIHEGRHAYQDYNLTVREVNSNHAAVEEWRVNNRHYESGESSIFDFRKVGFKLYWNQPVEYDARIFAGSLTEKLYKEWKI